MTSLGSTFSGCSSLKTIAGLEDWETGSVTTFQSTFNTCTNLPNEVFSAVEGWDSAKSTNMASMFYECDGLTSLDLSGWDVSRVTNVSGMFRGAGSLVSLDTTGWKLSACKDAGSVFYDCSSLTNVEGITSWEPGALTNLIYLQRMLLPAFDRPLRLGHL